VRLVGYLKGKLLYLFAIIYYSYFYNDVTIMCASNEIFCYILCPNTVMSAFSLAFQYLHKNYGSRLRLKCDGTRAETTFRLSAKRTSSCKAVCFSDSNVGNITF